MSAMGVKIDQFDVPVCTSFQAKILKDQLCYEVDPNLYKSFFTAEDLKYELKLYIDVNNDRQATSRDSVFKMHLDTLGTVNTFILKGTYKYDAITFRDIFTPPPPLSYCIIIWHTSGWCLFDDVILEQALRIRSYPVCCRFLSAKQTCKPYFLPC